MFGQVWAPFEHTPLKNAATIEAYMEKLLITNLKELFQLKRNTDKH